jgi:iron-sulfur cluster assembly accessory protein
MIVTASAAAKLAQMLAPGQYLRVSIRSGGCAGFTKQWHMEDVVHNDDILVEPGVVVDCDSWQLVQHATLDYVSSILKQGFDLQIPQSTMSCGCGKSFSL